MASTDAAREYLQTEEAVLEELAMLPGQLCGTLALICSEIARDKAERDARIGEPKNVANPLSHSGWTLKQISLENQEPAHCVFVQPASGAWRSPCWSP